MRLLHSRVRCQRLRDLRADMARHRGAAAGSGCADAQVRDFGIQRVAQLPPGRSSCSRRSPPLQQRALAVRMQPTQLRVDIGIEPDHESVVAQEFAIGRIEHGATAGGKHDAAATDELGEQALSRLRKPASPSISKVSAMLTPARSSKVRSRSTKASASCAARRRPIEVLPAPIGPTRKRLGAGFMPECYQRPIAAWATLRAFSESLIAMLRFILVFLVLLAVLFVAELTPFVERYVIVPFTSVLAEACAWIIHLFDGSTVSHGKLIQNANGSFIVSIERGCNGIEAVIILISAILAFPAPWKHRLVGLVLGFLAIQVLNLVRIVSLFFLGLWSPVWFEWFHCTCGRR